MFFGEKDKFKYASNIEASDYFNQGVFYLIKNDKDKSIDAFKMCMQSNRDYKAKIIDYLHSDYCEQYKDLAQEIANAIQTKCFSLVPRSKSSKLYRNLEENFEKLSSKNAKLIVVDTDDSDDEEFSGSNKFIPRIKKDKTPLKSEDMTVVSTYYGKSICFKGNQLLLWVRQMMAKVINTPEREARISQALISKVAIILTSNDWLNYEGMFDTFKNMPAKASEPFYGVLAIVLNDSAYTTVEFRNKWNWNKNIYQWEKSNILYAHIHDPVLIDYLINNLRFEDYKHHYYQGLSYPNIVEIIEWHIKYRKWTDAAIAQRQLQLFNHSVVEIITPFDRFLGFFNAVLFGSEASRNSVSFVTGLLVLQIISEGKLTYEEAFQTISQSSNNPNTPSSYAVYPMASPGAGSGNIIGYNSLVDLSLQEEKNRELSSCIGMKSSRKRPQWSQIQIKEAILLKYWSDDINHTPEWLNAESAKRNGYAVEFARQFNQKIVFLLSKYFPIVLKQYVYSQDELHGLGMFKISEKIWEDPEDPNSTVTNFDVLKWHLTNSKPFRLEKDLQEAVYDIKNEVQQEYGNGSPRLGGSEN